MSKSAIICAIDDCEINHLHHCPLHLRYYLFLEIKNQMLIQNCLNMII